MSIQCLVQLGLVMHVITVACVLRVDGAGAELSVYKNRGRSGNVIPTFQCLTSVSNFCTIREFLSYTCIYFYYYAYKHSQGPDEPYFLTLLSTTINRHKEKVLTSLLLESGCKGETASLGGRTPEGKRTF